MKVFKSILTILILVSFANIALAQNAEKTLVKSFNLAGNDVVQLDLKGKVDVQTWNNPIMRIQMNVALGNGSSSTLKSLVQAGRYNLKSIVKDGVYKVYSPGMERDIRIKGKELEEVMSYTVYLPSDVIIKPTAEASAEPKTGTNIK